MNYLTRYLKRALVKPPGEPPLSQHWADLFFQNPAWRDSISLFLQCWFSQELHISETLDSIFSSISITLSALQLTPISRPDIIFAPMHMCISITHCESSRAQAVEMWNETTLRIYSGGHKLLQFDDELGGLKEFWDCMFTSSWFLIPDAKFKDLSVRLFLF